MLHRAVKTRMHSSGMCTAHLLTISQHALCRGVSASGPGGVVCHGGGAGCLPLVLRGVYPIMQWDRHPPLWTDRHLWKHNLRKLSLRAVIRECCTCPLNRGGTLLVDTVRMRTRCGAVKRWRWTRYAPEFDSRGASQRPGSRSVKAYYTIIRARVALRKGEKFLCMQILN